MHYHREWHSNDVDKIESYRRVEDSSLHGTESQPMAGSSKEFQGNKYKLFQLVKTDVSGKKYICGFMIEKKRKFPNFTNELDQKFYYERERKGR